MAWSASEWALVIGSAGTAATAFGSIMLPVFQTFMERRNVEKRTIYKSLEEAIYFCCTNAGRFVEYGRELRMRHAIITSSGSAPEAEAVLERIAQEYNANTAKIELITATHGLDASIFLALSAALGSTHGSYHWQDGKLTPDGDQSEIYSAQIRIRSELTAAGAALLNSAREKFGV